MASFNVLDYYFNSEPKEGPARPLMAKSERKPSIDTSPDPYKGIGTRMANALRSAFDTEEEFLNTYSKRTSETVPDASASITRLQAIMDESGDSITNAPVNEFYNASYEETPEPLETPDYGMVGDIGITAQEAAELSKSQYRPRGYGGLMKKPSDIKEEKEDITKDIVAASGEETAVKIYDNPNQMSDREILARTIEAEAAGEAYKGKVAVGAVIANRAASGKYGEGIKGVILKKGQFSPWNSWTGYAKGQQGKDMMNLKPSSDAYKAADDILSGNYEDTTGGATHYLNPSVSKPYWLKDMKKRGAVSIGSHLFGNADSSKKYDGKRWISEQQR